MASGLLKLSYPRPTIGSFMEKQEQLRPDSDNPMVNEPHFDEEWTVLSARPVVPLAKLDSVSKRKTALKLAGAFAGALLLGALVALASIRLKRDSQAQVVTPSATELTQTTVNAAPIEEPSVSDEEQIPDESVDNTATNATDETTTPVAVAKTAVRVKVTPKKNETKPSSEAPGAPVSLETIAAEVLSQPNTTEQWQEKRPRRVNFRRRSLQGHARNRRGLARIDEIFEGSQHPQPPQR